MNKIKEIAKQTAYWISCIDGVDRTIRIQAAIEHSINEAIEAIEDINTKELLEQNERMKVAFLKYAKHINGCPYGVAMRFGEKSKCFCGLNEILSTTQPAKE